MIKTIMQLKAIDFFCSIGGMTNGFNQAGIPVIAGIDIDPSCKETYEFNNPQSKFIQADVKKYSFKNLQDDTKIVKDDDNLVFIGCSPCQYWTIINTDRTKSAESKNLLHDFQKFVEYFNPGYVVIENVPGIFKKAGESGLNKFLNSLRIRNYQIDCDILNANNFGVPQNRKRFVLIASRLRKITLPTSNGCILPTVRDFIGTWNGFSKIKAGNIDQSEFQHTTCSLSERNLQRIKLTKKDGGTREVWKDNNELQLLAYKNKDDSFRNVYGRMYWDRPAPTITTRFNSLSNGRFGHPDENRALSIREGATLQTFPKTYIFKENSITKIAKHIGNAVPPKLAYNIAKQILTQ